MQQRENKKKRIFIDGSISHDLIAKSIAAHSSKTQIGAHSVFLGQVRSDDVDGRIVSAIDYGAYKEMAEEEISAIREEAFSQYKLTCMHIYHSLGIIKAGEICFFVFVSAPHRRACFDGCEYVVEQVKKRVPIFGKEMLDDGSVMIKKNG